MNFEQFSETLICQLTPLFPPATEFRVQSIPKNNDIFQKALIIREPNTNISPTIYLHDYYKHFLNGTTIEALCRTIQDVFSEVRLSQPINARFFTDFEQAKKRLIFQVVNYEKNRTRLTELVHIKYLDLAIIFCCMVQLENEEIATVTVKKEHLQLWQTDADTIKQQAFFNTPRLLPASIQPLAEVLCDLCNENPLFQQFFSQAEQKDAQKEASMLYVLTNTAQNGGAACMLYPTVLEAFAKKLGKDIYILPSSIHELLLLPTNTQHTAVTDELNALIRQVNGEQLPASQHLSDHVYRYSRSSAAILL